MQDERRRLNLRKLFAHVEVIDRFAYEVLPPDNQTVSNVKDWKPEIERLAALGSIEYDRQRKVSATKLCIRIDTLDAEVEKCRPSSTSADNDRTITWPETRPLWKPSIY